MTVLITDQPGTNSYLTSLINAYKEKGLKVICGSRNFFYSNIVPDFLHIQWPEKLYGWYPFTSLSKDERINTIEERLKWYKLNNVPIIFTIHNIRPHFLQDSSFELKVFELIIQYSNVLVHHCKRSIELLFENYPDAKTKKNIVSRHGHYLIDYKEITKNDARKKLGIKHDKFVILNFGSQQRYKGEEFIEKTFNRLKIKNKFLLTAGNYSFAGYSKPGMILRMLRNIFRMNIPRSQKKYFYRTINPEELPYFISASDMIFTAHNRVTLNSGILPLAATYSRPVVFPDIGCFKEQMQGWFFECYQEGNNNGAVEALEKIYKRILKGENIPKDNLSWLNTNSWTENVQNVLDSLKVIINEPKA